MYDISDNKRTIKSFQCDTPAVAGESTLPSCGVEDVSIAQRSKAIVSGLVVILTHHRCPKALIDEMIHQVNGYLNSCENEEVWSKHAKSMLACPLARYLGNLLPTAPSHGYLLFTGRVKRWLDCRIKIFSRSNTHLWYSWFQGKRSALPASEGLISKTYDEHFRTLTHDDEGDDTTINRIFANPDFRRTMECVRTAFMLNLNKNCDFVTCQPSTSASFENTRSKGGQQATLREICGLEEFDYTDSNFINKFITCTKKVLLASDSPNGRSTLAYDDEWETEEEICISSKMIRIGSWEPTDELHSMIWKGILYKGKEIYYGTCVENRFHPDYNWGDTLKKAYQDFDNEKVLNATIQGVLEPLKIRVISKGESLPYYIMKPYQKALHSAMRDMSCFRLIGRTLSPTDLIDLKKHANYDDEWFSVDYSGATDGLSWKYSGRIFRYLIALLPERDRKIAMQVLGPHNLHYPDATTGKKIERGVMRTGQLMGSILSFPILCLANLGVYLSVMEEHNKFMSFDQKLEHVLINGDDMLYAAPASLWDSHIEVAAKVGLKMSVGKAYHHRAYANINSVSFHYNIRDHLNTPYQIDFLNVGLIFGQHKVMQKDSNLLTGQDTVDENEIELINPTWNTKVFVDLCKKANIDPSENPNYVSNINLILKGTLPGRQAEMLKYILFLKKDAIKRDCAVLCEKQKIVTNARLGTQMTYKKTVHTRNLFLPKSLGGMGVISPPGWQFKIKPIHRYFMHEALLASSAPVSYGLPAPGSPLEEEQDTLRAPWMQSVCSLVMSLSRKFIEKIFCLGTEIVRYTKSFRASFDLENVIPLLNDV